MYAFESRIRYSETDHHRTLTLPELINYFQDCSTLHSGSIGYGVEELEEVGRAWILSYWQIVADRYPRLGEHVTVSTWASKFRGFLGERNFLMTDESGGVCARAYSVWAYMDMKKGRPVRPGEEELARYGTEAPLEMEYAPRKIRLPEETEEGERIRVGKSHIDTNEHVNNCRYVQMALEALPEEILVRQVRVDYKKSAMLGDIIVPQIAREEDRTVVELTDPEGEIYAVVELTGE